MYESNPIKEVIALMGMMGLFLILTVAGLAMTVITEIIIYLPFIILAIGLSVGFVVWAWKSGNRKQQPEPAKVIERQTIIERQVVFLSPDTPRRELWQAITADKRPKLVEGKVKNGNAATD